MAAELPEVPTLGSVEPTEGPEPIDPTKDGTGDAPPPPEPEPGKVWDTAPVPDLVPVERYWTEDRIVRLVMSGAFLVFAVGLVISLARWELMARVPFLPWLVGAALLAGPAWKAYTDLQEEARASRARAAREEMGHGPVVRTPRDRGLS